jgi:hypothetical protein
MFTITGEIKVIKETVQVTEKFKKREFVLIDDSSQYPQFISFQLTQDRCGLLDASNVGDRITVNFNLRGREWTDKQGVVKYFNSLEVWRVETGVSSPASDIPPMPSTFNDEEDDGGLPF